MLSPGEVAALWYRATDAATPLAQGDQLWSLSLLDAFADEAGAVRVDRLSANLIVLTQSCDLEHGKVTSVLTSPMYTLDEWLQANPADLSRLEDIRRGYDPSLYLLPAWTDTPVVLARADRVVDLGELRVIPYAVLRSAVNTGLDRAALSSPAREHFSQAVARAFMRVGLPADIPSFELKRLGEDDLLVSDLPQADAEPRLAKPLRVSRRRYLRPRTGEVYWLVTTRGYNPSLMGAGGDEAGAISSLGAQVALALGRLRDGDAAWRWLEDYLRR